MNHVTAVQIAQELFVRDYHRVSNVKNEHLQNNLLTVVTCWTNSHLNTAAAAINSINSLRWKLIKMSANYEITSCNSRKR